MNSRGIRVKNGGAFSYENNRKTKIGSQRQPAETTCLLFNFI